jgi:hypothetical protein
VADRVTAVPSEIRGEPTDMTDLRMGPYHDPSFHALFRDGSMIGWSDADLVRGFTSNRGESIVEKLVSEAEASKPAGN